VSRSPFQSHGADQPLSLCEREGRGTAGRGLAQQIFVRPRDDGRLAFERRIDHARFLVERLLHRPLDRPCKVRARIELRGMRHGAHLDLRALQHTEHDPVAAKLGRKLGREGAGAFLEARVLQQRGDEIERDLEPLPLRLLRIDVTPHQEFQPSRAPLQLADGRLYPRFGPRVDVQADGTVHAAVDAHRVRELIAWSRFPGAVARQHDPAPLAQCALGHRRKQRAVRRLPEKSNRRKRPRAGLQ